MMLRAKLTLVAVGAAIIAILVTVVTSYRTVSPLVGTQFDRGLSDRADAVLALLDTDHPIPVRPDMIEQLLLPDGTVRPLDPGRKPLPVTETERAVARGGQASAERDIVIDGHEYGLLTRARPGGGAVMVSQSYADVNRVDHEFVWRTAVITVAAICAAALFSWLAAGGVLRPIRRLVTVGEHIATTQDLATPLPPAGRDEVGRLTRSFATMLAALRFSRAQQQRLVQDASHELRTPLTSVRGSAELLQRARGRLAPNDENRVLATLVGEATALDALVRELVDLATDQHTAEDTAAVDVADLLEECAQRSRRRTGRPMTVTAAPLTIEARPRALTRCIDNLLDNATKYSPDDTSVHIDLNGTTVTVRDHGPGIAPADQPLVFNRFYRANPTRTTPGTGLGLAIVADIVSAHGGRVFARNHPDGGAEVGFHLPGGEAPPAHRLPWKRQRGTISHPR
ncbi:HAMP domain-containing sensor histidine kinase [Nocardia terpenica]|uniref:histidine kinase n=1 Tax=Nocardia terpenica TaxID=455432 RepID=A0A291RNE9_9NOCA|nr:HAMP domain-containing sensor histidine kinase [Nocardia terpenica]ATL68714.1 two-component sensor histidine kinase [Nocardia terpenica]